MSIYFEFKIYIYQLRFSLCQIFSSNLSQLNVYIIYHQKIVQGLEGYFWDSGFDQNTVQESGKR